MKNIFYNLFLCFFVLFGYVDRINGCEYIENSDDSLYWDIYPDTWVATDALGRMMQIIKRLVMLKEISSVLLVFSMLLGILMHWLVLIFLIKQMFLRF